VHGHCLDADAAPVQRCKDRRHGTPAVGHAASQLPAAQRDLPYTAQSAHDRSGVLDRPVGDLDLDNLALETVLQLFRCALDHHAAAADDREPVGQLVRLLEVVRGEQNGQRLAVCEEAQLLPHGGSRLRIQPGRGLVQKQHLRPVHEPQRHVESALHPARIPSDDAVGRVRDPDQVEQLSDPGAQLAPAHPLDVALQHQVLAPGRVAVDAGALGDVADRAAHRVGVADDVVARHLAPPGVGARERGEHLDRGRLPGAVRPEKGENLAGAHAERHPRESLHLSVALPKTLRDQRFHGG